ncbi:MAG: tetratricopeptide repeat protein [Proteobacteria bacterium]|nr:tetratricopeptide repeat protein [Pseudomonadota bacterium]
MSAGTEFDTAYAHVRAGRMAEAEAILQRIVTSDPDDAGVLHLLGVIAAGRDDGAEAVALFARAIEAKPGFATAHSNLGAALLRRGEISGAIDHLEKAIELAPDLAHAHGNLGNAFEASGRYEDAAKAYRRALILDRRDAETHNNLGNVLLRLGQAEAAAASYRRALAIEPEHLGALSNLGNALHALGRADEAVASFRRALMVKPDFADALANLGNVFHFERKLADAEGCLRRAIEAEPNFAMAHSNLGALLRDMGRYGEAEESLTRALEIDPDHVAANANLAYLLLTLADFARAWRRYALRPSVRHRRQALWQEPLPDGLDGKRVFLRTDQGLGDDIFFLRFAPAVKERGAWICHDPGPKIASIVARLPFIDEIIGDGETPQGVDITLSAGDLPLALGMESIADIPPPVALAPEPGRTDAMRARLAGFGPAPYIGVTWRAGTRDKPGSLFKEAPLDGVGGALKQAGGTVAVLQRNPEAGEIDALSRALGREVHDFTALNDELEDMLALLALLDDYVTVSNTNVHLRAGAGRTSRVLVPNPPEYRWMAEGDESPWFPGCAVYRQRADGDWDGAFERLSRDLAADFPGVS